jgi:uncharacterized membrane protein
MTAETDITASPRGSNWLAEAGIVAMIGFAIALTNWFNPGGMELGARMAFWIGGMLAALALFKALARVGSAVAQLLGIAPVWGQLITIPLMTVVVSWLVLWLVGGLDAALGESFAVIWPQTLAIGAAIFALFFVIYARRQNSGASERQAEVLDRVSSATDQPGLSRTALHDRLPPGFPAIIALSVEDHYVRIHAVDRSEMVLMPLTEAIALMPAEQGAQVHRSWWVARNCIIDTLRAGRDIKLRLIDQTEVPVSRSKVTDLRAKGWLT